MFTLALRTDADQVRAQNHVLSTVGPRAADLNTAADLLRRSLMLFQSFSKKEDLRECFGFQVDLLSNAVAAIRRDLDEEHLAEDAVSLDGVAELRQAYERAVA